MTDSPDFAPAPTGPGGSRSSPARESTASASRRMGVWPASRLRELAPLVFDAAGYGDGVARAIVDRLADEVAGMAIAMIRRLRLVRLDVDVVLAGGIMRNRDRLFYERIEAAVRKVARRASIRRVAQRPVLGAALLGLDRLAGEDHDAAEKRLRSVFAP